MGMSDLDELCTPSDSLWGSMSLSQKLQMIEFIGGQLKRIVGVLI
jgi:hypothetical protein